VRRLLAIAAPALVAAAALAHPWTVASRPHAARAASPAGPTRTWETIGRSVRGAPIRALRLGDPGAATSVLVVGCIHGDETAGRAVIDRLARAATPPSGVALWLVRDANPDGCRAHTRQNAHGVDLNRNFPYRWERLPQGTFHSGPRPLSEPESRAIQGLIRRERPAVSLWYHQHAALVDSYGDASIARRYARRAGLPYKAFYAAPGSITRWQVHTYPSSTGIVVELPAGALTARAATRHARAALALAAEQAPRAATAAVARPRILERPIPYGPKRRADMAAYSLRHYGQREWRLTPRAIVEHWTQNSSVSQTINTFAPNAPDPELHELPGVCSHFVIARDGTIVQMVPTSIRCRHAFGMNHAAIGIEHVGFSDSEVMGNPRQLAASLALTRWLACRYGVRVPDVVGHAETLSSRFYTEIHPERYGHSTHGDMGRRAMTRYRAMLASRACG
jgi:hypothetical protein